MVSPGWLEDVREFTQEHRTVSPAMLHRRLRIPCQAGEELLRELEKEGIVGPPSPFGTREALRHG